MKTTPHLIRKQRKYSESFKRQVVSEFESGKYSVVQLEKLYKIPNPTLYLWIYKYSTFNEQGYRVVEMKASSSEKLRALEQQVKDLERLVGQKQIQIEYLEKLIELAKTELNIDIKKNSNTQPWNGSVDTPTK